MPVPVAFWPTQVPCAEYWIVVSWPGTKETSPFAGGAVIVSFMALVLSSLGIFKSIGPALAIAVFVTVIAALTLVPAIVALLGTRVFWPSKSWKVEPEAARFAAVGRSLGRHPVRYAVASGGILAVLALFAFGYLFGFVGLLLAVPLAAAAGVLARFAVRRYRESLFYTGSPLS